MKGSNRSKNKVTKSVTGGVQAATGAKVPGFPVVSYGLKSCSKSYSAQASVLGSLWDPCRVSFVINSGSETGFTK